MPKKESKTQSLTEKQFDEIIKKVLRPVPKEKEVLQWHAT